MVYKLYNVYAKLHERHFRKKHYIPKGVGMQDISKDLKLNPDEEIVIDNDTLRDRFMEGVNWLLG